MAEDGVDDYFVSVPAGARETGEGRTRQDAARLQLPAPVRPMPRSGVDHRGLLALVLAGVLLTAGWRSGLIGVGGAGAGDALLAGSAAPPGAARHGLDRVLAPPPVPAQGSSYSFLSTVGADPISWSACEQVHVVYRVDGEVAGGRALLLDALAQVSAATGLSIVDDGSTGESPSDTRPAYQPDRYGPRWAPVLIAWSDPAESGELAGDVAAVAGPVPYAPAGQRERYVSGTVPLDAPQLTEVLAQPGGAVAARGVVLHELGHLVGLGHVDDPTQVMAPRADARSPTLYADGDRRGLALLGSQPCP